MGSLEITELIRRQHRARNFLARRVAIHPACPVCPARSAAWRQPKGFLVQRQCGIDHLRRDRAGRESHARRTRNQTASDGTFSFRFALPDGKYDLPAVAVSADGDDARAAELKFSRETEYLGDVGAHPQDPALKPPLPENL